MKCRFTFLLACVIAATYSFGQVEKGLEGIIVEKYYVSDANDASNTNGGVLPIGSTTYRIYVDMKPGYKFLAAYGENTHGLLIKTTTKFFNNEDRGDVFPTFNKNALKGNTVMLDSWLSAGGACVGNLGVLKSKDDGVGTVVNSDGILTNTDSKAGTPLKEQDGMKLGKVQPVQAAGLDGVTNFLNNTNDFPNGVEFSSNSGAWFTTLGAVGADSLDNMVLIAQLTTDGILQFELNVQLATPTPGVTEKYVAKDPIEGEIFEPSLVYDSSKTATKDINNYSTFNSYPNPTSGDIYFNVKDLDKVSPYMIIDMDGKVVQSGFINPSSQRLSMVDLKNGVYILELNVNGKRAFNRVVKI